MYHAIFAQSLFTREPAHPNPEVAHLQRTARESRAAAPGPERAPAPAARPAWTFRLIHPVRAHRAAVAAH